MKVDKKKRTAHASKQRIERAVDKVTSCSWVRECDAVNLILTERARLKREVRKAIRERGDEYMRDADNPKMKNMAAINASRAWAFKDFADDIITLWEA